MIPEILTLEILEEAINNPSEDNISDNGTIDVFSTIEDLPYYDASALIDMGVYNITSSSNYFDCPPDNYIIGEDIRTSQWFEQYKMLCNGIITQEYLDLSIDRLRKLQELYLDYDSIIKEGSISRINARKQSILELGHNPEISFNLKIRTRINEMRRVELSSKLESFEEVIAEDINCRDYLTESVHKIKDSVVYVVLTYTGTTFGKIISKVTNCKYSHAGISFNSDLSEVYSFNGSTNGFSHESIKKYMSESKEARIVVYGIVLPKFKLDTMKTTVETIKKSDYSYSFLTGLTAVLNKPMKRNNAMICSQFVDSILKSGKINILKRDSSVVLPSHFYGTKSKRMIKLFEGPMIDYNSIKAASLIGNYIEKNPVEESVVLEVKEFPAGFDEDGNLLIKNMKKLDYNLEYSKSHKLLKSYEKSENYYPMAYELSKLWFMNSLLEEKIYNGKIKPEEKKDLFTIRSKILNDFNRYLPILCEHEKGFNFTHYYNDTPFSDSVYKINHSTIKYSIDLLKNIKLLML